MKTAHTSCFSEIDHDLVVRLYDIARDELNRINFGKSDITCQLQGSLPIPANDIS